MSQQTSWWRLVAGREVTTCLRDKTFLISSALLAALVFGGIVFSRVRGGGPASYDVAVTDASAGRLAQAAQAQLRTQPGENAAEVNVTKLVDRRAARSAVADEEVDAALLPTGDGFELLGRDEVPSELSSAVQTALSLSALESNAEQAGTTLDALTAGSTLSEDTTATGPVTADAASGIAFVMALLFFMTAIGFGSSIAQSVVVEKENRIVEILAAAVPLLALLWGKVLGNNMLALAHVVVVAVAACLGLLVMGDLDTIPAVGVAGAWFLAFFVVGLLALASLCSVAGALATRQDDLQATTVPGQALLFIPYLIAVAGNDHMLEVASFMPIASSMIMPARLVDGDVPLWQPVLSLLLAAAAAAMLVRLGARWYERTLLQTSRRTTYRDLLGQRGEGSDAR